MNSYTLGQVLNSEYREWALYTAEARAIPNMIDGLKPVQRFYLYSSLKNTPTAFKKVSAVSGVLSDYGYNHAETSGAGAGQLMAATWSNNICLVQGRGNFGSRLVQSAGAPRYVYTKVHKNFSKYMKDIDLCPVHPDPEHEPPAFYLPVIPLVLANGTSGVATGFSTKILPRDPDDLAECCLEYTKTGKVRKRPRLKFPDFNGTVHWDDQKDNWVVRGKVELKGKTTAVITEVPPNYDHEKYIERVLKKLEDKGDITGFEDQTEKTFQFEVKLKRGKTWTEEQLIDLFKLEKTYAENLTVVGPDSKVREYDDVRDIIVDFCKYREGILEKRIEKRLLDSRNELQWLENKLNFLYMILNDEVPFKERTRLQLVNLLKHPEDGIPNCPQENAERLLRIQIAGLSKDEVRNLEKDIRNQKQVIKYWETTNPKKEFKNDLEEIRNDT